MAPGSVTTADVKRELKRLRQGLALGHPSVVLQLSAPLRGHLTAGRSSLADVTALVTALRVTISSLDPNERLYAEVDFNLAEDHNHATLTARQESLARELKCASKTVRRRCDQALETLAHLLVARPASQSREAPRDHDTAEARRASQGWRDDLRAFWKMRDNSRVDIVCSEIPPEERPYFASPDDRNYLRYAKFADLDSLVYVRTRLTQAFPDIVIRDFSPSEYYDTEAEKLVVIGGPPWNAKYREFLPQLPYHFEPHTLGEDDPLVVPLLDDLTIGPRWAGGGELVEDLAVFTRLTLSQGTVVVLLGGCLTLGVLASAKCFLQRDRGARNARFVGDLVGDDDFVLVTEARRVGGITDTVDLPTDGPLLLLSRNGAGPFKVVTDNTTRYTDR